MAAFQKHKNGKTQARIRLLGVDVSEYFETLKEAKHWASLMEAEIRKGKSKKSIENEKEVAKFDYENATVDDALDLYETTQTLLSNEKSRLKILKQDLEGVLISKITPFFIQQYFLNKQKEVIPRAYRKKVNTPDSTKTYTTTTLRKYFYFLKKVLKLHSDKYDYQFNEKAFQGDKPKMNDHRERILEENELERLINACYTLYVNQEEMHTYILFAIESCMRAQEVLLMKWSDIYIDEKEPSNSYIIVPKKNTKNKNRSTVDNVRYISMTPELFRICIEELPKFKKKGEEKVFYMWKSSNALAQRFKIVRKNAKVENFRIHDFRHTGITNLFKTNLTDIEISKITGHKNLDTLKIYANMRAPAIGKKLWDSFK